MVVLSVDIVLCNKVSLLVERSIHNVSAPRWMKCVSGSVAVCRTSLRARWFGLLQGDSSLSAELLASSRWQKPEEACTRQRWSVIAGSAASLNKMHALSCRVRLCLYDGVPVMTPVAIRMMLLLRQQQKHQPYCE